MKRPPIMVAMRIEVAGLTEQPIVMETIRRAYRGSYPAQQIDCVFGALPATLDDATRQELMQLLERALYTQPKEETA